MALETIANLAIGVFAVIGTVIGSVLTIQFANNASRNMSQTNAQASQSIDRADDQ